MEGYIDLEVFWDRCSSTSEAMDGFVFRFKKQERANLYGLLLCVDWKCCYCLYFWVLSEFKKKTIAAVNAICFGWHM